MMYDERYFADMITSSIWGFDIVPKKYTKLMVYFSSRLIVLGIIKDSEYAYTPTGNGILLTIFITGKISKKKNLDSRKLL